MTSIRARLLVSLLVMMALAAVVVAALTYRTVHAQAEALFDYQLRQMALSLRDQGEVDPAQASALADGQLEFVVQIWTADGRTIYGSRPPAALPRRALLGLADVAVGNEVWRSFTVATRARVIQVAQPLAIRRRLAAEAALNSVWPLLLLAPLLAAAAWALTSLALRPLRRVADDVRQRDAQSLAALPVAGLPDEVAPLVEALNALLHRLGESLDAQRAFVADAAHELRSPLTALKLQLQLLRRSVDDAQRHSAVTALGEGIERASRLVEQLLTLARSEPGAAAPPRSDVELGELTREALAAVVPLAEARGTTLQLHAEEPARVQGDAAALSALVRNLADNAVRYSPRGARLEVQVATIDGAPTLTVEDSGPGIPAPDRERVFDRFYRRQQGDAAGTGLGLAIVRSVAAQHGASLSLDESPLGGLRVRVRFGS